MCFNRASVAQIGRCALCVSSLSRPPDVKVWNLMESLNSILRRRPMWGKMPNFARRRGSVEGLQDASVCQRCFRYIRWFLLQLRMGSADTGRCTHTHTLRCKVEQSNEWPTVSPSHLLLQLFHQRVSSGTRTIHTLVHVDAHTHSLPPFLLAVLPF